MRFVHFYRLVRILRKGNVFGRVCLSFCKCVCSEVGGSPYDRFNGTPNSLYYMDTWDPPLPIQAIGKQAVGLWVKCLVGDHKSSCGKVMFSQVSVNHSIHKVGGDLYLWSQVPSEGIHRGVTPPVLTSSVATKAGSMHSTGTLSCR